MLAHLHDMQVCRGPGELGAYSNDVELCARLERWSYPLW